MKSHGITYIDSSAVVGKLLGDGIHPALIKPDNKLRLYSSPLLYSEVAAVARREGVALKEVDIITRGIEWVIPASQLKHEVAQVLAVGYARGADLFHLATALWLAGSNVKELRFITLDVPQQELAGKLGFNMQIA